MGFPCGSAGKESACNVGDLGLIPGLGRSFGQRKGYPLLYSGLENSMDCIVHGVAKNQTRLSNFHFHLSVCIYTIYIVHFDLLESKQRLASFFLKGQIVEIFWACDPKMVTVATTQLCPLYYEVFMDEMQINGHDCVLKNFSYKSRWWICLLCRSLS